MKVWLLEIEGEESKVFESLIDAFLEAKATIKSWVGNGASEMDYQEWVQEMRDSFDEFKGFYLDSEIWCYPIEFFPKTIRFS